MKIRSGLFVLIVTVLLSGSTSHLPAAEISGTLTGFEGNSLTINGDPVPVDASGQFRYVSDADRESYYEIDYGKTVTLYLHPADRIAMQIDARKPISEIQITGDRLNINRYLIKEAHESSLTNEKFMKNFVGVVSMREDAFVEYIHNLWQPFEQRFDTFVKEKNIADRWFINSQSVILLYSKAGILLRYPGWHRQFKAVGSFRPSEHYYNFLGELDMDDPRWLDIREYREFLVYYLDYKAETLSSTYEQLRDKNYYPFRLKFQTAIDIFSEPEILNATMYPIMKRLLTDYYHKGIDDLIELCKTHCTECDQISDIDQILRWDRSEI
jgi:hypothetical protein